MQHTKTCPMMQLLIANVFGLETFRQRSLAKLSNNVRSVPQSHWISNAKLCPSTAWFVVSINRMLQVSPRPSGRWWRRSSPRVYPTTTTSRTSRPCISFSFHDEPLLTDPGFVLVDTPSSERRFRSRMYGMRSSGMIGLVYCEKAWVGTTGPVMIEEIHTID